MLFGEWRERRGYARPAAVNDPGRYLEDLREQTRYIDIRGLQVGTGKAYRFPITDLYIPLTTASRQEVRRSARLEEALNEPRLVIVGEPGSGKTTFLRWLVFQYAGDPQQPLPLLVRISELAEHIRNCSGQKRSPTSESPEWLVHFLTAKSDELNWSLDAAFFKKTLSEGSCVLLLDGLDEAPSVEERSRMARIFEGATRAYPKCRIVVTTRPQSYAGTALLAGFTEARIEPLDDEAIGQFLEHWCRALFPTSEAEAKAHLTGLQTALHAKVEIRRMVVNPVMLTALAVVHWNEKRIPEQRADLYESVLQWLARSREQRLGRASASRCLELLKLLALAMQDHPDGRKTELSLGESVRVLDGEFSNQRSGAEAFLLEEEGDSGIIVRRDSQLRFWHLTFQEYLAARCIAGFPDEQQYKLLLDSGKIYLPEWRESALLLAGVLMGQGRESVDSLFSALLDRLGSKAKLPQQARTAGLLGAMVGDLRPFQYEPKDPRYARLMDAVLGVFKAESVDTIDFKTRLEAAEALGQAGDPRLGDKAENWIRIECEKPFRIARYPVTVQEYKSFVEDGGYQDQRFWVAGGFGQWQEPDGWAEQLAHPNRPVVEVSWFEAAAYARWARVRLLTEAEWERAARGTEGREYPWGEEAPSPRLANYREGKVGHPTPVGLYPLGATPERIQDLAGNVWEWCEDWYDPSEKKYRNSRGGSWVYNGSTCAARSATTTGRRAASSIGASGWAGKWIPLDPFSLFPFLFGHAPGAGTMGTPMSDTPKVFISSTAEDLREYRLAAHDAAIRAGFTPVMMEYFVASGAKPPLAACLDKVRATDVVVILVAKWYGWKPPGQTTEHHVVGVRGRAGSDPVCGRSEGRLAGGPGRRVPADRRAEARPVLDGSCWPTCSRAWRA